MTNSVSRLVGYQLQKQINHFEQTSPLAGSDYKFGFTIEQMDGGNDRVLEKFELEGCWITNAAYDALDYGSDEVLSVSLTIKMDNATQSDGLFPLIAPGLPPSGMVG